MKWCLNRTMGRLFVSAGSNGKEGFNHFLGLTLNPKPGM